MKKYISHNCKTKKSLSLHSLLCGLGLMLALISPAGAVTLSLNPSDLTIPVLSNFSIDLVLSDLDVTGGEAVGGFDVDIFYDPLQTEFLGWGMGSLLGDVTNPFEALDLSFGDPSATGVIDLFELSLLSGSELLAIQSESFVLASLDFQCLGCGVSTIEIDSTDFLLDVSDQNGSPYPVTIGNGVTVTQVPEPATLLLIMAGMVAIRRHLLVSHSL